ncbi:MAG: methylated-DNA/protein-cysteine methyltransferase [Rhodocyclales bacterium]|nr:methylated-DNA/protein-cysteine methyltransferase [Rhodocyclales bacterium]
MPRLLQLQPYCSQQPLSTIPRSTPAANYAAILPLPCCRLGISADAAMHLSALTFLAPDTPLMAATGAHVDLVKSVEQALMHWLTNPAYQFEFALAPQGTPFQRRTWQAIASIPFGEIRTYGELSREAGGTPRAIGQACGANPFPIIVPCHRVVAKTGLGGFANASDGWLLETKRWLLRHEGVL